MTGESRSTLLKLSVLVAAPGTSGATVQPSITATVDFVARQTRAHRCPS